MLGPRGFRELLVDRLDELEAQSIFILREAVNRLQPIGMLWSIGKDSNTLLWLARKAFFGRVPFPVILLDTGNEFPEVYQFRDRIIREWHLTYIDAPCPGAEETDPSLGLKRIIAERGFQGVILGIRRDEQAIRSKERIFSPRDATGAWNFRHQPPEFWDQFNAEPPPGGHVRVHPLLGWTEIDVWRYVEREGMPVVPLYFARDGRRFRSLGEKDITFPVPSTATTIAEIILELEASHEPERAGRAMDHESEDAFERLRAQGYM